MKFRESFISNSSSTSFIISNRSNNPKTLLDFAKENIYLLHEFNDEYSNGFTEKEFLKSAQNDYPEEKWKPHQEKLCIFGDEQGPVVGKVYDYILRNGGVSKNFKWRFHESLR